MAGEIFTEQEEQILEQLKSVIFYSEGSILSEARRILKFSEKERAADILETALSQIGFEQKQRRDYVLSSMGINTEEAKTVDAEVFVRAVGNYGNNQAQIQNLVFSAKLDSSLFKFTNTTDEVLEQARTFNVVASNLENMFSNFLYEKRIKPIVALLKKLPPDRLNSVLAQTKDYIQRVQRLGNDIIQKNPDFSNAMQQLFELTGLNVISDHKETIGQKLEFCGDILLVAGILNTSKNQDNKLTDEQIQRATGMWLYNLEGSPLAEEMLVD